jgi:hypothetical protein
MQGSGFMLFWSVLAAAVAALSLGPSFAHVLESGPRLHVWSPELWREATVFNQQFKLFLIVGAPLDIAAILAPAVLTYLLRGDSPAFGFALGTTVFFALALLAWFLVVRRPIRFSRSGRPDRYRMISTRSAGAGKPVTWWLRG